MNVFVGIDNGADGAVIAIDMHWRVILQEPAPVIDVSTPKGGRKRIPNPQRMAEIIRALIAHAANGTRLLDASKVCVVLEKAQAYPKEGAVASFTYGRGYGCWEGVLAMSGVRYEIVDPKAWQKLELAGVEGVDTKARSLLKAQRSLSGFSPIMPRCRVAHPGFGDAGCMAMHAVRVWTPRGGVGPSKLPPPPPGKPS